MGANSKRTGKNEVFTSSGWRVAPFLFLGGIFFDMMKIQTCRVITMYKMVTTESRFCIVITYTTSMNIFVILELATNRIRKFAQRHVNLF